MKRWLRGIAWALLLLVALLVSALLLWRSARPAWPWQQGVEPAGADAVGPVLNEEQTQQLTSVMAELAQAVEAAQVVSSDGKQSWDETAWRQRVLPALAAARSVWSAVPLATHRTIIPTEDLQIAFWKHFRLCTIAVLEARRRALVAGDLENAQQLFAQLSKLITHGYRDDLLSRLMAYSALASLGNQAQMAALQGLSSAQLSAFAQELAAFRQELPLLGEVIPGQRSTQERLLQQQFPALMEQTSFARSILGLEEEEMRRDMLAAAGAVLETYAAPSPLAAAQILHNQMRGAYWSNPLVAGWLEMVVAQLPQTLLQEQESAQRLQLLSAGVSILASGREEGFYPTAWPQVAGAPSVTLRRQGDGSLIVATARPLLPGQAPEELTLQLPALPEPVAPNADF